MKNIPFTISMLVISLLLASKMARAQGTIEVMCRSKAKEIALQTYQNCVTEEKTARLQDLKSRYKSRMSEVKDEFQRELDEINGKQTSPKAAAKKGAKAKPMVKSEPLTVKTVKAEARAQKAAKAEKPVAGVATALPAKQNDNGPAEPIQAASDEQAVVAATPAADLAPSDSSPEPEIIDMSSEQ